MGVEAVQGDDKAVDTRKSAYVRHIDGLKHAHVDIRKHFHGTGNRLTIPVAGDIEAPIAEIKVVERKTAQVKKITAIGGNLYRSLL